jgi:hypothetical protein
MNNKEAQQHLTRLRLLDPPADGQWGQQSIAALREFQLTSKLLIGNLDDKTKLALARAPDVVIECENDLAGRIVRHMLAQGYWVPAGNQLYSIVYVEGMGVDGTLNSDDPNEWNDARFVIEVIGGTPRIVGAWSATTEPGDHYTYYPMNPGGAFRIRFGQYQAWQMGLHGNSDPHEALIQVNLIKGFRDFNQDFMRIGDQVEEGLFGVNQHWGYDMKKVGVASAGCLVGCSRRGHREFMDILRQDRRYRTNSRYTFFTAILPGDKLT